MKIGPKEAALRATRQASQARQPYRACACGGGLEPNDPYDGVCFTCHNTALALTAAPRDFTPDEARIHTDKINASAGELCDLLAEAHERKAWKALGYPTWEKYAEHEFVISRRRTYQLLDQAKVRRALSEALCTYVHISDLEARDVKDDIPAVIEDAKERVSTGEEPTKAAKAAVKAAVQSRKPKAAAPGGKKSTDSPPQPTRVDVVPELQKALETAHYRIKDLEAERDTLTATLRDVADKDTSAKAVIRWRKQASQLEGRINALLAELNEAQGQAKGYHKILVATREALGQPKDTPFRDLPKIARDLMTSA